MAEDNSLFPIDEYTLGQLEEISYHVKAARWHTAKAIRATNPLTNGDGRQDLESSFKTISNLEEQIQESVQRKQQSLNE